MKFSVIIPTYDRLEYLEKALNSVAAQTYSNYEIIVVNDNPADKAKIDKLIAGFDKIQVIHHPQSRGGNAARNSGILHSTGELIAFLDDDDVWLPEKLAAHLNEHQQKPLSGLVFSNCLYVYDNQFIGDHITSTRLPSNVIEAMGRADFCPPTSSLVSIRRECVEKCGLFDESLVSLQDWDYWFRIAHVFEFSQIPVVLVHFKQHLGERTSHNEKKRRKGLGQIIDKWKAEINTRVFTKNLIRSMYYKNSRNALMMGDKLNAFKTSFKLLSREVISIQSLKNFMRIFLGVMGRGKSDLDSVRMVNDK